jgi:hypothetical protein
MPDTSETRDTPEMPEMPETSWLEQLDDLLATLDAHPESGQDAAFMERIVALDLDLQRFLVERMAEQDSPQAAAFLELLAAHAATPEPVRAAAREARDALAARGIIPAAPGEERFLAGWVQQSRETGEQILLLGWRMPAGGVEALVFLLDWRGDGLKDFYRTRDMSDAEWRQLVAHNATKGAPLAEVTIPEARALLEAAQAESRRFSRPMPRDYKLEARLIERRVLSATPLPADVPPYLRSDLAPEAIVTAYNDALHYRDYALAALLLHPDHPDRAGRGVNQSAAEMRDRLKHAPRREAGASVTRRPESPQGEAGDTVTLEAQAMEVAVDKRGGRTRTPASEIFVLRTSTDGWRIAHSAPAS